MTAAARRASGEAALERGLLTGVVAFRWATWAWMALVLAIDARNHSLAHLAAAVVPVALALGFTSWATATVRTRPGLLLAPVAMAVELAIAGSLVFVDQWAYGSAHSQSLGSAWPLASVMTVAIAGGVVPGAAAGLGLGRGALVGRSAVRARPLDRGPGPVVVGLARALHARRGRGRLRRRSPPPRPSAGSRPPGPERRWPGPSTTVCCRPWPWSNDARRTRSWWGWPATRSTSCASSSSGSIATTTNGPLTATEGSGLAHELRDVAARAERQHGLRVTVVLADVQPVPDDVGRALAGAVGEALTNAAKHGEAGSATVFVDAEESGGIFCSIKDDGHGFDPDTTVEGIGLTRSIRGRVVELGGRVEVDGRPGRGAEVRLWVP